MTDIKNVISDYEAALARFAKTKAQTAVEAAWAHADAVTEASRKAPAHLWPLTLAARLRVALAARRYQRAVEAARRALYRAS